MQDAIRISITIKLSFPSFPYRDCIKYGNLVKFYAVPFQPVSTSFPGCASLGFRAAVVTMASEGLVRGKCCTGKRGRGGAGTVLRSRRPALTVLILTFISKTDFPHNNKNKIFLFNYREIIKPKLKHCY